MRVCCIIISSAMMREGPWWSPWGRESRLTILKARTWSILSLMSLPRGYNKMASVEFRTTDESHFAIIVKIRLHYSVRVVSVNSGER